MREIFRPFRFGVVLFVLLFSAAGIVQSTAQTAARPPAGKPPLPDEMSQAELIEAYHNVREQLRATQTAIINNHFETEANARAQAAAIAEKLEAMNVVLENERKFRQQEADRFAYEHERQQAELRRSNNAVVWVASGFGVMGLLAMVCAAIFQWRSINRMAEVVDQRALLPMRSSHPSLPALPAATSQTLALSTQRLMSAIDRMEQRIKELEHTAEPSASSGTNPSIPSTPPADQTHAALA